MYVLVATDFSEASEPALREAYRIAAACRARLMFLHVYQVPTAAHLSFTPATVYSDDEQAIRTDIGKRLEQLVAQARSRVSTRAGSSARDFRTTRSWPWPKR